MSANAPAESDADLPDAHAFIAVGNGHTCALTPDLADDLGLDEPHGHVTFSSGDEVPRSAAVKSWEHFGAAFIAVDEDGRRLDNDHPSRVVVRPSQRGDREDILRESIEAWQAGRGFRVGEDDPRERGMVRALHSSSPTRHEREQQAKQDEHIAEIAAAAAQAVVDAQNGVDDRTAEAAVSKAVSATANDGFECECGATFATQKALNGHQKAHRGER